MKRQETQNQRTTVSQPSVPVLGYLLAGLVLMGLPVVSVSTAGEATQLKEAARAEFQAANPDKARVHLEALLGLYRAEHASNPSWRGRYQFSRRLAEVAHEYLRAGQLDDAIVILGEAADLDVPPRAGFENGLAHAAGGLHRQLAALSSDDCYDLLHDWSMPTATRRSVRELISFVPLQSPPSVFARALGERPRDESFPIAQVGDVSGLFSTAWELVRTAGDAGRLRQLTAELEKLAGQDIANAEYVLTLAKIVVANRRDEELMADLTQLQSQIRTGRPATGRRETGAFDSPWQYGFGVFDAFSEKLTEFTLVPVWTGHAWQFTPDRPHEVHGFLRLDRMGGHPAARSACVRRWTAPANGTLSVTGTLFHPAEAGDGVCGRLVSTRTGLCGEWTTHNSSTATDVEPTHVEVGDTIDFVVDCLESDSYDTFAWMVQLRLETSDGRQRMYDSAGDFCGPHDKHVLADAVLAAACLDQSWLQPVGEGIFEQLIANTYDTDTWTNRPEETESPVLRPALQRAWATAVRKRFGDGNLNTLQDGGLQWWVAAGAASWLSHEDHILHLAGSGKDFLFSKYPLTGAFEFSCEAQAGGRPPTDGGVAYGGRNYVFNGLEQLLTISDLQAGDEIVRPCPTLRIGAQRGQPEFNRISLVSAIDGLTLKSNGQAIWSDASPNHGSPWLALQTNGDRRPMFRNLRLAGDPVIPREVRMADGDSLRGWLAIDTDWFAKDGIIRSARLETESTAVAQSRLSYLRPLLDGEAISYEFHYEAGEYEVHPALGRLALLIEPDGVRLHWITDGDREWTGLAEDNAVVEPFDRRGPKPLPLVAGDWNKMTIAIAGGNVTLSLNGQLIYQRKLEPQDERTFGFYHDACQSAVRVRNVVMRGDWPERLTPQQLDDLAALTDPERSAADRRALNIIFQETYLSQNLLEVVRRASSLPEAARYDLLAEWVLPAKDAATIRATGTFAPLQPPPISFLFAPPRVSADKSRVSTGAHLVAPALELVTVAKQLGRLDELRRRVGSIPVTSEAEPRAREALLCLIDIADAKWQAANDHLTRLLELHSQDLGVYDRWPEMLAIDIALRHQETFESARELVGALDSQLNRGGETVDPDAFDRHVWALGGSTVQPNVEALAPTQPPAPLRQWTPVSRYTAASRGLGFPLARWQLSPKQFDHRGGHATDSVYFRSPLRGNFQVDCEVSSFDWREIHLAVAGAWIAPYHDHSKYLFGNLRETRTTGNTGIISPRLTQVQAWIHYRIDVRDGRLTAFFNGRQVHQQELSPQHDPWLAIRSSWLFNGSVRDLRIIGDPVIPPEVRLAETDDLSGWLPYLDESVASASDNSDWQRIEGELVGRRRPESPGGSLESLLQYHRPMLEDGTIEYEFYYEPGTVHVHPALDRLAFLLEPAGVRIHWVTDGGYERAQVDPGNSFEEPQHRRGPNPLPLKPNQWNRLRLTLAGDVVTIALNDTLVYQRPLEPTNMRTLGLFRYANQTEARLRNIVWQGDWPRELPALHQQELADVDLVAALDARLPKLAAVFEHDFSQPIPRGWLGGWLDHPDIRIRPDGLHVDRRLPGRDNHFQLYSLFRMAGDFDVAASFDELDMHIVTEPGTGAHVSLLTSFPTPERDEVFINRDLHDSGDQKLDAARFRARPGGERSGPWTDYVHDGPAGTFRIARRGETLYLLFAEGDSDQFRLLDQGTLPADVDADAIRLTTLVFGKVGTISVVWKKLTVRAEALPQQGSALAATLSPDEGHKTARFIRVELPGPFRILSLAEVQVFGDSRNVAAGKPAKQSSTAWEGFAKLAVDGNTNGQFAVARSTTHTEREQDPWWEVDLGRSYDIDRVLIWNRSDIGGELLRPFRVQLLDEKRAVIWAEAPEPQPTEADN